ncbi:MAE_28990/MAE_18760 family HEPN-like nuclease [Vreelandella venusta]|uniref:MAE_28990/MAE_18760 family HEPN-like nuclease n=1 Tax=Vreelandella venusta TaxID=44935 RepID=UPI00384D5413
MDSYIQEYEKRKVEINAYLDLLTAMSQENAKIVDFDENEHAIDPLAFKVCKASSYLIIYNLIEATVTAGVKSIYDKISDERLTFNEVMENLRKVWWQSKKESLSNCAKNQLIDNIYDYYCAAHSDDPLDFSDYISGVSGNLDAEVVREVCRRYGISSVRDGRDLGDIKTKRNWLAHGNKSFSDIGKDSTPSDLYSVRDRVFSFLDEFVLNVNTYLRETKYRSASETRM